ncbi:MAG: endonuclease III [Deltaproteobacteria bacterium]|nr:endonuclease III [Deltaproteobacteria bacterium]
MNKSQKVQQIQTMLSEYYPNPGVPLDHSDSYTLLVAVMLSAQTTDKKVNEVTPELFALADNPKEMSKQSVEDIKERIKYIGLSNNKAKNLKKLSSIIHNKHNDIVPDNYEDLEALPGVGHKTASVVMSQAFGHPAFPVDTHIHRLAYRWGLSNGKNVVQTEKDLKRLFPKELWNDLHIQIILFGREHCPARGHKPDICPICSWAGIKKRLKEETKKK